ncbi:hypothetical protein Nepgr_029064 [Nepenthes gracilis]|uniref:Uncharacterized protein n=1 Tax=Nepenthes gracilis TaxID=150966 RepID=A0AAD3TDI0_NEPGR|nr:hypothetical protein Nepgr_029064 [Nepenthes gracilis]
MKPDLTNINLNKKAESNSLWKWNVGKNGKQRENRFPAAQVFHTNRRRSAKTDLEPGGGIGVGCGVGLGLGLVGGIGYSGWPWNHLRPVFGVGMGCGIGFGFGYGMGFGYGFTLESLKSYLSAKKSDPEKWIVIQI